jgi:hypothetical protein
MGGRNRIHCNHTYNPIRVTASVQLDEETAGGEANEHVRVGYISRYEGIVKITLRCNRIGGA